MSHRKIRDAARQRMAETGESYATARGKVIEAHKGAATVPCCDLHGRNCEPPSELCCRECTEARHGAWRDERDTLRFGHPRGETCSSPGLPLPRLRPWRQYIRALASGQDAQWEGEASGQ